MENYVVCEKKGSQPRIHVEICRHRCKEVETCLAFEDHRRTHLETLVEGPDLVSMPIRDIVSTKAA